jgi:hypothetical protein
MLTAARGDRLAAFTPARIVSTATAARLGDFTDFQGT